MQPQVIHFHPHRPAGRLARLGDRLRDHRRAILALQWLVVIAYAVLLIGPALRPLPDETAHLWNDLTLAAQFAFWGLWWPFVLLSMVGLGRVWCGLLCPEGALTEFASRWSLGRPIPRWLRWGGWPFVAFALTTVYGQLVSVYQYPQAVLLVLGGSTVAAVGVGLVYTRGKRVWCRHLCPVNGVFGLLAKLAPLHYRADEAAWRASLGTRAASVDCAPLLPLRQLDSASACHGCGRCSGHRGAIRLEARSPNAEILERGAHDGDRWQSALVIFGMIGLAMGAFEWSASPWLVAAKQAIAEWLVERDVLWPLDSDAPWWLLTHYPAVNDSFSWLDGALLLGWMGASMLLVGGAVAGLLALASRLLGGGGTNAGHDGMSRPGIGRRAFHHLSLGLVPLAGAGVFLGLSATTVTLLKGERLPLGWVSPTRATLLAAATGWSLYLAWRICGQHAATPVRRMAAWCAVLAACLLVDYGWSLWFWRW